MLLSVRVRMDRNIEWFAVFEALNVRVGRGGYLGVDCVVAGEDRHPITLVDALHHHTLIMKTC